MDEGNSIIYGLELQTRALAPQLGEQEAIRFLIGTQSLKQNHNQIHVVELEEETGALHTKVFNHPMGEIWQLRCSPHDVAVFVTTHNAYDNETSQCLMGTSLCKLPSVDVIPKDMDDLSSMHKKQTESVQLLASFKPPKPELEVKSSELNPNDQNNLCIVNESSIILYDIETGSVISTASPDGKSHLKFSGGKWNPHQNGCQFAAIQDTHIKCFDTRSDSQKPTWTLDSAQGQLLRDLDFNPNSQFHLATVGDDAMLKIWDFRNKSEPVFLRSDHSHWVWTVRYNTYHDQLLLTGSSDGRALLTSASGVSSDMYEASTKSDDKLEDGVLQSYEQHEDSVYCVEWSSTDPWTFASLSYDGRLVLSKVPKHFKYKILL